MTLESLVAARLGGLAADVLDVAEQWAEERRRLWDRLRSCVVQLTGELTHASRLGGAVGRARAARVLARVGVVERERRRIEDEAWALLRTAGEDDRGWQRRLDDGLRRLAAARSEIARIAEGAAAEWSAIAGAGAFGKQGAARLAVERARVEAYVDAWSKARAIDLARVAARGGPAPARVRAAIPLAVPRKRARIPRFVLVRFYRKGSLRADAGGVRLAFVNPLGFAIIQGGEPLVVDGKPFPKARTLLDSGDRRVRGNELTDCSYLKFPRGGQVEVVLEGLALRPGPHRIACALELRKLGWVELTVADTL